MRRKLAQPAAFLVTNQYNQIGELFERSNQVLVRLNCAREIELLCLILLHLLDLLLLLHLDLLQRVVQLIKQFLRKVERINEKKFFFRPFRWC